MNKLAFFSVLFVFGLLAGCSSSQKITSSWVNTPELSGQPYRNICVVAITPNKKVKGIVEEDMVRFIEKRGGKAVKSIDIFPTTLSDDKQKNKEILLKVLKDAGCDGVLTVTRLDVKTEARYVPGSPTVYAPSYKYRYYANYHDYYNYRMPEVSASGYLTRETTYFLESNFYDLKSEKILWSIQSDAFDPTSVDDWFKGYSKLLVKQLKNEGLLRR